MSATGLLQRLTRDLGVVWPSHEQDLILRAIFAPPQQALAAFAAWRGDVDVAQHFDRAVMRLLPLLYLRMLELGQQDPLMGRLKGVYRRAWSDTQALFHGTAPALAALRTAGIDTMLLKGAPMVLCHYRNHGSRPMADTDIAVRFGDAEAAFRALGGAGWQAETPVTRDDLAFRHAKPFRGPDGHEIDLHWHMLFESTGADADAPFWHHTQPATLRGVATACLTPALTLLHTLAHGLRPNTETPVRWIADALTVLRDPTAPIDWSLFCQTAAVLGLSHRMLLGLAYLRDHYGQVIPSAAIQALGRARRGPAEALELAVINRRTGWHRPVVLDRGLLVTAEFSRLARQKSPLAAVALLPDFVRYRLGIASWRGAVHGALRRVNRRPRPVSG